MLSPSVVDSIAVGRGASADELAALDRDGYVVVPSLLDDDEVAALADGFERLLALDAQATRHELGTRRTHATNDDPVFAVCWRHRVAIDAAAHVIGSDTFEVGHVDLRDPRPTHGEQALHGDHGDDPVAGLTVTWFIDPFTVDNGATLVVPGSHHGAAGDAVPVIGPAGSVLLRDARLLHGGAHNDTSGTRRSALVFYQRDMPPPTSR